MLEKCESGAEATRLPHTWEERYRNEGRGGREDERPLHCERPLHRTRKGKSLVASIVNEEHWNSRKKVLSGTVFTSNTTWLWWELDVRLR